MRFIAFFAFLNFALFLFPSCKNGSGQTDPKQALVANYDTVVGYKGCDKTAFVPMSEDSIDFRYPDHVARLYIGKDTSGNSLTVVNYHGGPFYKISLAKDEQFFGISRDYMYIDKASGPGNQKTWIAYTLLGQHELARDLYIGDIEIASSGKVWYWTPIEMADIPEGKVPDCAALDSLGQGTQFNYAQRKTYDPFSHVSIRKSEYMCVPK